MSKRICIGKIVAAHGIKGYVKIFPMCEDLDLLNGPMFTDETGPETVEIKTKNSVGKFLLAEVKGIADRNAAEKLKCSLFVSRETLPQPEDGVLYITDLVGMDVYDHTSQRIGSVSAVENFGASDLIEVQPLSGKAFYIPYTDDFIKTVDIDAGRVEVQSISDFQEN